MNLPTQITCVEDTIKIIRQIRNEILNGNQKDFFSHNTLNIKNSFLDIWFRGESQCYEMPLCPKLFRVNYDETKIFDFLPTYHQELREIGSDFDMLCYLQHHGIPTRLLDWTDNILIALYFAVESHPESDSKLFILNSRLLNTYTGLRKGNKNIHVKDSIGTIFRCLMIRSEDSVEWKNKTSKALGEKFNWRRSDLNTIPIAEIFSSTIDKIENNLNLEVELFCTPVAVRPDKFHKRIIHQSGLFTLHGGKNKGSGHAMGGMEIPKPMSLAELNKNRKFLLDFTIPRNSKSDIKNDLISLQIHKGTIFPELEHQQELIDLLALRED